MTRINRKLIIATLVGLILTTVLCSWGNFNHRNSRQHSQRQLSIGAHFSYSTLEKQDLRTPNCDIYLLENYNTPLWVYQDLHKKGKTVGVKIYQETHPWPQTAYIDNFIPRTMKYVDFYMFWEENGTEMIPEMNSSYDYIKENWPDVQVYQSLSTNRFDFARIGEVKADGFVINPRWWYSPYFEEKFLNPALATGKPIINGIYLGVCSDGTQYHPTATWEYAIDQYKACRDNNVPVVVYEMFWPEYEELVKERIKILLKS